MDERLIRFMKKLRLWLFCRRLLDLLLWCVTAGVAAAAVMEVVSYFVPWYSVHRWAAAAVAAGFLVALVVAAVRYPRAKEAAAALDRTGLNERTMTAWELLGSEGIFAEIQKKDTWERISGQPIRKRLPIRMSWRRPVLLAVLCAAFAFCSLIPSPARTQAKSVHELGEAAKEKVQKVEKAKEEIEKNKEFTDKELEELENTLSEIKKELGGVKTETSLAKAQERAEKKLNQMAEKADSEKKKSQLKKLADMLGGKDGNKDPQNPGSSDKSGNAEKKQAAEDIDKQLDKLQEELDENGNPDGMSEEELEQLAKEIAELSEASADDLSESEISDLAKIEEELSAGEIRDSTITAAKAAISSIKNATASESGDSPDGPSGEAAEGSSEGGEGPSGGNGNGNGSGSGSGNGNGSGSGQGGSGNGQGGVGSGSGWNKGSNVGKETESSYNGEKITVPDNEGDDGNLTGRENKGTSYSVEGGNSPTWSGNQVQYDQVIGDYSRQAKSQIEKAGYPSGVKDIIKSYFETLE